MKNVCPAGLLLIPTQAWMVPSGFTTYNVAIGFVTLVAYTTIRCPAVALKLNRASWPPTVVVLVTAEPSMLIDRVSSGLNFIHRDTLYVVVPAGSIKIE